MKDITDSKLAKWCDLWDGGFVRMFDDPEPIFAPRVPTAAERKQHRDSQRFQRFLRDAFDLKD